MTGSDRVTVKIKPTTKMALDIYQARQLVETGKRVTNDAAILQLLEIVDPEAVAKAKEVVEGSESDE